MPSTTARPSVKASTVPSIRISCARGRSGQAERRQSRRGSRTRRARPSVPPMTVSSSASVTSWRATRPRAAPSALRVASSFNRPLARTSDRFVMLTAAISSTNSTPPHSSCSAARTLRTRSASKGTIARVVARIDQRAASERRPARRCDVQGVEPCLRLLQRRARRRGAQSLVVLAVRGGLRLAARRERERHPHPDLGLEEA